MSEFIIIKSDFHKSGHKNVCVSFTQKIYTRVYSFVQFSQKVFMKNSDTFKEYNILKVLGSMFFKCLFIGQVRLSLFWWIIFQRHTEKEIDLNPIHTKLEMKYYSYITILSKIYFAILLAVRDWYQLMHRQVVKQVFNYRM